MSFENAPFSKGLAVGLALTSITIGLFDVKHYFHLQVFPHISRYYQYWRLLTHNLAFSSSGDLFLAELILCNVGVVIERHFGTLKFASFTLVSTFLAALLEFAVLVLCHNLGLTHIPAGPSALIFSLLYQYSRIIPPTYDFRIFGVPLNNKSFTYLLAAQLALGRLPGSAAAAGIGIVAGQIYRSDIIPLKTYRITPSVSNFSKRFLLPVVGSLRPPRRTNLAFPQRRANPLEASQTEEVVTTARPGPGTTTSRLRTAARPSAESRASVVREWVHGLTGRGDGTTPGLRIPAEAEITQLTNMFPDIPREAVIGALQRSANAESAVETLLSSQR